MLLRTIAAFILFTIFSNPLQAQLRWQRVDSLFGELPASVQVYRSYDSVAGEPGIAYYLKANLRDRDLIFTTDTTDGRRLTPDQFQQRHPDAIAIMNCSFFSFETNRNLGLVMRDGKLLAYNVHNIFQKKDSNYRYVLAGSFGINRKRKPDVAWVFTDSSTNKVRAWQNYVLSKTITGKKVKVNMREIRQTLDRSAGKPKRWRMQTAVAGGPVLVQDGRVAVYNNEELKFAGKAIDDRHPRTAVGYTGDGHVIFLVVEGRRTGLAAGATLTQLAQMLVELGCVEALNLDGGGSSSLLVNGRETIKPSDKEGKQRPIPAILLIKKRFNP
ncbi:MAG: phosphodiester glycosidase family protein [Chitinophagaceae bacterium]|nr:phosphodiester glycosidase family protein [Chitinophagaceae bacterium]